MHVEQMYLTYQRLLRSLVTLCQGYFLLWDRWVVLLWINIKVRDRNVTEKMMFNTIL